MLRFDSATRLLMCVLAPTFAFLPEESWSQQDGQRLLTACGNFVEYLDTGRIGDEETLEGLWCGGYLSGIVDGVTSTQKQLGGKAIVCLPPGGITAERLARTVVEYLRKNPDQLGASIRTSTLNAIGNAFPCPQRPTISRISSQAGRRSTDTGN